MALFNSDLTSKEIKVSKDTVKQFLSNQSTTRNKKALAEMEKRMVWEAKREPEERKIRALFSKQMADFIIGTPDVKFTFDRLQDKPDRAAEIVTAQTYYRNKDNIYHQTTDYTHHALLLQQPDIITEIPGKESRGKIDKVNSLLLLNDTRKKLSEPRRMPTGEPDRVLISLNPDIQENSSPIRKIEEFLSNQYPKEINRFIVQQTQEQKDMFYAGSSADARVSSAVKPTRYVSTGRFGRY